MTRLLAEPYRDGTTRLVPVAALTAGDRVVYRHRGQLVAEVVATAEQLTRPAGYIAVRFVGRALPVHYPVTSCLQVAPATTEEP